MMKDIGDDDGILQIGGRGTAFQGSFCTRGFTEGATISSIRGIMIMTMVTEIFVNDQAYKKNYDRDDDGDDENSDDRGEDDNKRVHRGGNQQLFR